MADPRPFKALHVFPVYGSLGVIHEGDPVPGGWQHYFRDTETLAAETLRLVSLNITLAQKAALLDEVSSALDDGRLFMPSRDPGRTSAEALVDKIRALYRPKAKKE